MKLSVLPLSISFSFFSIASGLLADAGSYIIIDDWKASKLCSKPEPACCQGSSCSIPETQNCAELAGNQIVSYCNSSQSEKFGWSSAAPCSIIGSYRDIGLKASSDCSNNQNSIYTSVRVNPLCSSLLIQGNQLLGVSQTKASGTLVWDFGNFPNTLSDLNSTGLANSAVISALGSEIKAGSGTLNIPVCHKVNSGDPAPVLKVGLHFSDGSSYTETESQNSNLRLSTTSCANSDSDLIFQCPKFNIIKIQIPPQFSSKTLGAVKIDFFDVSKLFIGQLSVSCNQQASVSDTGLVSGQRVFSCNSSVPACILPAAAPTATPTPGAECNSLDIRNTQRALDTNSNELRDTGMKALQQLSNAQKNAKLSAKDSKILSAYAINAGNSLARYYSAAWSAAWALPNTILTCNSSLCVSVSNAQNKNSISEANKAMLSIIESIQKRIQGIQSKAKKNKAANLKAVNKALTTVNKLYKDADSLNKNGLTELGKIPANHSQCN